MRGMDQKFENDFLVPKFFGFTAHVYLVNFPLNWNTINKIFFEIEQIYDFYNVVRILELENF